MNTQTDEEKEVFRVVWNDLNELMQRWKDTDVDINLVLSTRLLHLLMGYKASFRGGLGFELFDGLVPDHKQAVVALGKKRAERN